MDKIDGYLSRRVQTVWPQGLVITRDVADRVEYIVQRPGESDIGLGDTFSRAQQACDALLAAERARKKND